VRASSLFSVFVSLVEESFIVWHHCSLRTLSTVLTLRIPLLQSLVLLELLHKNLASLFVSEVVPSIKAGKVIIKLVDVGVPIDSLP
jgi:hypothetical protein